MLEHKMYTVESVTSGHPDKVCDQISDAILDECLRQDPMSRVAIETFGCHGVIVVGGEITTQARVDAEKIARQVYKSIGYRDEPEIVVRIQKQSPDISQGVDTGGAGDQGIMYGYASSETPEYLPRVVVLAHQLTKGLEDLRKQGRIDWLEPDGKSQVTIRDGRLQTVLISTQHKEDANQEQIAGELEEKLIKPLVEDMEDIEVLVNPTGKFVQGGIHADTGLTGRKIMVDTYGGFVPHGGGCFSGKDATKVDRSAAYMARFAAKNLAANGWAEKCLVSVAYAIGREAPVMVEAVNEKGESVAEKIGGNFDFRPRAIIDRLDLRKPIYQPSASYGHFGRQEFPWEEIVQVR